MNAQKFVKLFTVSEHGLHLLATRSIHSMGTICKIKNLSGNQQKKNVSSTLLREIIVTKYAIVAEDEMLFLKVDRQVNRMIGCDRYSSSGSINFL